MYAQSQNFVLIAEFFTLFLKKKFAFTWSPARCRSDSVKPAGFPFAISSVTSRLSPSI